MGAAKRRTVKKVNRSQPTELLKQKQKNTLRALLAEQKRQEQMRKEFEAFLASQTLNNNTNNWYFPANKQRKTRRLRR
jgi:uncharacterized damage-inducible protein DinB